jgi:hypothetical protein
LIFSFGANGLLEKRIISLLRHDYIERVRDSCGEGESRIFGKDPLLIFELDLYPFRFIFITLDIESEFDLNLQLHFVQFSHVPNEFQALKGIFAQYWCLFVEDRGVLTFVSNSLLTHNSQFHD